MRKNTTFGIGNVALLDKVNAHFDFFERVFKGVSTKAKNLKESSKLFIYNRLEKCVSINRLKSVYPVELFEHLDFKSVPGDRTFYRDLERIGKHSKIIFANYQGLLKKDNMASGKQFVDFSSAYFEGNQAEMGKLGYSRDNQPGKKQVNFGISTGINGIPCALTIQKGNVQDKKHMKFILNTLKKVLPKKSLLIFDCGGNTKANKEKILNLEFNYLTLKAKKKKVYHRYIALFNDEEKQKFSLNKRPYECVKLIEGKEIKYIFFCEDLKKDQINKRNKKFEKELIKNEGKLKKTKKGKVLGTYLSREGYILAKGSLQEVLSGVKNPFITGLEGYFIIESSVDEIPEEILRNYKGRDKAEKLIRDMKEGTELRPIRHWSTLAVIGYLLIIFLTNCIINLTLFLSRSPVVKNVKLLKKYLNNLTLTIVYPKNRFRFSILANISEEIKPILGKFIQKYEDKSLELRW